MQDICQNQRCTKCKTAKNPDEFYSNRPTICIRCSLAWAKKNYQRKRERIRSRNKEHAQQTRGYLRSYGITAEQYDSMLLEQGNCCKICRTPANTLTRRLAVDHDHCTGEVRGLLCNSCNTGIGHFRDSPELLLQAISYLSA